MIKDSRRLLAIAGIVAPVGFIASALSQSLLRDDHSLLADPISALAAGSGGWMQNATFAVAGALFVAFALGLHTTVRPSKAGILGPLFMVLFGVGMLGAAVFPAANTAGVFIEDEIPVQHVAAGIVAFLSVGPAAVLLSWRLARDAGWSDLAGYVRATGVTLLVLFVGGGVLIRPTGAPLHDWLGAFQWVFILVWFICVLRLAARVFRLPSANMMSGPRSVPADS